jgi:hypothetical protein
VLRETRVAERARAGREIARQHLHLVAQRDETRNHRAREERVADHALAPQERETHAAAENQRDDGENRETGELGGQSERRGDPAEAEQRGEDHQHEPDAHLRARFQRRDGLLRLDETAATARSRRPS